MTRVIPLKMAPTYVRHHRHTANLMESMRSSTRKSRRSSTSPALMWTTAVSAVSRTLSWGSDRLKSRNSLQHDKHHLIERMPAMMWTTTKVQAVSRSLAQAIVKLLIRQGNDMSKSRDFLQYGQHHFIQRIITYEIHCTVQRVCHSRFKHSLYNIYRQKVVNT